VCSGDRVLLTLFVFVCVKWCPTHIVLCFCFVCLRLVSPMLSVSLDCQYLIALRYSLTFIYPGTLFTKHPLISGPVKLTEKLTGMSAKF